MTKDAGSRWKLTPESLLWVLVFFLSLYWLLSLPTLWERLFCPFQVNQEEAPMVEFGRIFLRHGALYPDPAVGPYLHLAYPPLFFILESWGLSLITGPWLPGRLMAFSGYIGCGMILFIWGRKRWKLPWLLALILLFWSLPTWRLWGTMVRVDTFLLAVHFGIFIFLYSLEKKVSIRPWKIPLGGFLGFGALLLKQSAISLMASYGFFLFLRRRFKDLAVFLFCGMGSFFLFYAAAQKATDGHFGFYVIQQLPVAYHWGNFLNLFLNSFLPEAGWLVAAVGWMLLSGKIPLLLKCQIFFSSLWIFALGRKGGAENYYLEFLLFGIFALGEGWARLEGLSKTARNSDWAAVLFLFAGLVSILYRPEPNLPTLAEMRMKTQALDFYKGPGEHLALDLDLPLMADKRLWIMPMEYDDMVRNGVRSTEPLIRDIKERKFTTIELYDIPRQYLMPESVVWMVEQNYQLKTRAFGRRWYVPK